MGLKAQSLRSGAVEDERREAAVIGRFLGLCLPEACRTLDEDPVGMVFCDLRLIDAAPTVRRIEGDLSVLIDGVRIALDTYCQRRPEHLSEHIVASVSRALAERRDRRIARLNKLRPEEVVTKVLGLVERNARYHAAMLLDHLTFGQLVRVLDILKTELRGKVSILRLGRDHEPQDGVLWLAWYAGRLCALEPGVREKLTEGALADHTFVLIREEGAPQRTDRRGDPLNLAGPMWVKHVNKLARISGRPEEGSISAVARSHNVSRDIVRRWKQKGVDLPEPFVDGNRVGIDFTVDDALHALEIVEGQKRGPQPKRS